jgi:membrane protein implicated in regulation of membrane protease activity
MLIRAAEQVAEHARRVARLELELAELEVKQKIGAIGAGIGMLVGAAVLGLFALGFGLAAAAAGLATFLPTWLALLLVGAGLLVLTGVLAALARASVRKGSPPVPELALLEAKRTREALKNGAG